MLPGCSELVLATGNPHKVAELRRLLAMLEIPLLSLAEFPHVIPVDESGLTLAENARLKAAGYASQLGAWVLADDTGLEVDGLNGSPGVRSARYAGENATMPQNRAKLLAELREIAPDQRTARFVCHLAIANPEGDIAVEAVGECRGSMRLDPAGSGGFGYDTLFEVAGLSVTLAELSPDQTERIGHRGAAVRDLISKLRSC